MEQTLVQRHDPSKIKNRYIDERPRIEVSRYLPNGTSSKYTAGVRIPEAMKCIADTPR